MENQTTKKEKGKLSVSALRYLMLIAITVILIIVFGSLNPAFLGTSNLMNIARQVGVTLIVSIGVTFIILTGGIDLSVGSNVAFSGMLGIVVLNSTGSTVLAVVSTVALATAFGFVNGFIVGKLKITAFIVTLGMQFFGRGATMLLNNASSIKVNNAFYKAVGQGSVGPIPVVLLIVAVLYIVFCLVNDRSVFGRELYAIGGNSDAARASGINVDKKLILVYTLAGLIAGIGAIVSVGRMGSAQPYSGQGLEFDCITAAVLGGTSLDGGKGNLKGTIIGAVLVGIISNGLSMLRMPTYFQYVCTGALVLIAVGSDLLITYYSNQKLVPKLSAAELAERQKTGSETAATYEEIRSSERTVVEMRSITKAFPSMKALDNVNLTLRPHEVHALMGENGAGKSTLMKILSGEESATTGGIYINGKRVEVNTPIEAKELGIALIHQETALIPELSVAQNIFLGREEKRGRVFLNIGAMNRAAQQVMDRFGMGIDVRRKAGSLTISEQQMVEIAKALETDAWLIIMDEPTSSLTEREKEKLFDIIEKLKEDGIYVVYISHRMQEIFRICDKITILRDGKLVGVENVRLAKEDTIISMMVGRELNNIFDRQREEPGEAVLEVRHLCKKGVFDDVSFTVHAKEVLGMSGLVGAGRTEVARCIFGLDKPDSGEILLNGKPVHIRNTGEALKMGIAYVPEDRKKDGFVPLMSIGENIAMASYDQLSKGGFLNAAAEKKLADDYVKLLQIKTTSIDKNVVELSGGNQQKVSLANRLATKPKVLILDEPTRGIDIGAKAEIHKLIADIARQGVAVILISSEMPELIGCADRVLVLREGRVTAELEGEGLDQDTIMSYAAQR